MIITSFVITVKWRIQILLKIKCGEPRPDQSSYLLKFWSILEDCVISWCHIVLMQLHVPNEAARLRKSSIAQNTHETPFASMRSHVGTQATRLIESFLAQTAIVGPITCVSLKYRIIFLNASRIQMEISSRTRMWAVKSPDWANVFEHHWHSYGRSPVWMPAKETKKFRLRRLPPHRPTNINVRIYQISDVGPLQ